MEIIPVIDLLGGKVVRGVGGQRSNYQPVHSCLAPVPTPEACVRALSQSFRTHTIYVADLDAIERGHPDCIAWQNMLAATTADLWLDAGWPDLDSMQRMLEPIAVDRDRCHPILATESLRDRNSVATVARGLGADRLVFSLDLDHGEVRTRDPSWRRADPLQIVEEVVGAGIQTIIVLDIANVGSRSGLTTLAVCDSILQRHPTTRLVSGGGVRDRSDLQRLANIGCVAAIVSTALHDGALLAADIEWARTIGR